ncbi:four-helix bundle copper-binding protein [Paenibacillus oceani]|uniref:Four-helix bundle copper-binding protein n=1 Tax=Paenibacillus oceani TaxID=2772510 RepID=A0A927C6G4_9BACL|nr:four-helix bundle copper-binding protein [Paenibacillus oceani]MBD2862244.1 four-helix bundle copper-binding protein [Paenibacillus oceani]
MSTEQIQSCMEECLQAVMACNHCYQACLEEYHAGMLKASIRLSRECAEICAFAAQAMSLNSSYAKQICMICAEVCEACAQECRKHDHDPCQRCAEACYSCALACKAMAG